MKRTIIIGGGAAGFFAAINLKEMCPDMQVTILEKANTVLRKVAVSGGGRCNCTNSFREVSDLSKVYPRGHRLLKRLFKGFNHEDAYRWFEQHGVRLVTQNDQCVFPASQDSHTIINMFLAEARKLGITIQTGKKVMSLEELSDYDFKVITTGGFPNGSEPQWTKHEIVTPVPSLFTFNIEDPGIRSLMGTVIEQATATISGTKLRADGPLLITHWGMSGPAILRLSSYAARQLADNDYHLPLSINWVSRNEDETLQELNEISIRHGMKQVVSIRPFSLPSRLWEHLAEKSLGERAHYRWKDITKKELNRLTNQLVNDTYQINGRAPFKDEFVTCGGVALTAVNPVTLESKTQPGLYFAGEVLDIDGVTGGFNFQAAWTTAYTVARAIADKTNDEEKMNNFDSVP